MNVNELLVLATGQDSDEYVLFLDLLRTSAALEKYNQTQNIMDRAEIAHMQSHFISSLGRLCNDKMFSNVRTVQASDCAYSFCSSLDELMSFAASAFKCMTFRDTDFFFVPVRGGISKGLVKISDGGTLQSVKNFKYTSEIGIGMVESAYLEKNGPKGMRLFVSDSLKSEIPSFFQKSIRTVKDGKGKDIFEFNWMHTDSHNKIYLAANFKQGTFKDVLVQHKENLKTGNSYQQNVATSLVELINWT